MATFPGVEEMCYSNMVHTFSRNGSPRTSLTRSSASTVPERILLKIAVTTYRAVNGSAPAYLSSYFTRVTDVPSRQRLRSTSSNQLAVPLFNFSTVGKQTFAVSNANFWNSLPPHVTSAPSLAIFRQRLKTFLFHLVLCGLNFLICSLLHCGPSDNFVY